MTSKKSQPVSSAPELLHQARSQAGLNRRQASEVCQVSYSSYEKWERGVNPIPTPTLIGCLYLLGAAEQQLSIAAHQLTH